MESVLSRAALAGTLLLAALASPADEIHLRGGGRISGMIVKQTPRQVVIETGPGLVTLPMSRIERIETSTSALEVYRERASRLAPGDAQGWANLARWAAEAGLAGQARESWRRVLAVDPQNAEAREALGEVLHGGRWMSADDAYRARGYVQADGRWLTPAEHEARLREQAAEHAADAARAEQRVREAEARAREAEAEARAAEAAAATNASTDDWMGYPVPYGYGAWGWDRGDRPRQDHGGGRPPEPPGRRAEPAPGNERSSGGSLGARPESSGRKPSSAGVAKPRR